MRIWGLGSLGCHFYCKYYEKNSRKAPYNYSASFWIGNFSISLWERSKTPNFHEFGIFERVLEPQNQLFLFLETPGYLKQSRLISGIFLENMMFINLGFFFEIQIVDKFRKGGRRKIPPIRLIKS